MATLIGTVVLLALLYYAYRAGRRRLVARPRTRGPLRDRLDDPTPRGGLVWADTAGEARECELSRRLISGRIDPAAKSSPQLRRSSFADSRASPASIERGRCRGQRVRGLGASVVSASRRCRGHLPSLDGYVTGPRTLCGPAWGAHRCTRNDGHPWGGQHDIT